jgi:hypothetical protein
MHAKEKIVNTEKESRRNFVRGAATAAALAVPLEPLLGGKEPGGSVAHKL